MVEGTAIPNGRHFGYLRSVELSSQTITFDQAYNLGYDEANQAAARAGIEYPVPNDYYIQNLSSQLWRIELADDVRVEIIGGRDCCEPRPIDLDEFARLFGSEEPPPEEIYGGGRTPYSITIAGQRVTRIEQQYVP